MLNALVCEVNGIKFYNPSSLRITSERFAFFKGWRQVELEPWREEAHQRVMRLLAFGGQRGAALAQYETCRRRLAEELGVEPGEETTRLYEQIRDGDLKAPVPASAAPPDLTARPRRLHRQWFLDRLVGIAVRRNQERGAHPVN